MTVAVDRLRAATTKDDRLRTATTAMQREGIPSGRALTLAASILEGTPRPKVRTELEPPASPPPIRTDAPAPKQRSLGQRLAKHVASASKKKEPAPDDALDSANENIAPQNA